MRIEAFVRERSDTRYIGRMRAGALLLTLAACRFDPGGLGAADARVIADADAADVDAADSPPCATSDDLIGCWRFESPDPTLVDDESPANNDGVASGGGRESRPGGGSALLLSASSDVAIPDSVSLDVTGPITIELWLRADTIPAAGRAGVIDHNGQWGLFLAPGGQLRCVMPPVTATDLVVTPGVWTHIACVYDLQTVQLYQDGVAAANPPPATTAINTAPVDGIHIGEDSPGGGDQLLGAVDDVRIWRTARTAAEIAGGGGVSGGRAGSASR
jgi:hypothetical protein